MIRVLSVDDHPVVREGIAALTARQSDMELIAEASNGRDAVEQFRTHRPDVTLMDLQMPEMSGIECVSAMMERGSTQRFLRTADNLDIGVYRGCASGHSEFGAQLAFWSKVGAGTEVQLTFTAEWRTSQIFVPQGRWR